MLARRHFLMIGCAALLLCVFGCSKAATEKAPTDAPAQSPAAAATNLAADNGASSKSVADAGSTTVTVSVAASTREVLQELADEFRTAHGIEVRLNAGPSSGLANQIIAGAPADLFLSASTKWSAAVAEAGLAEDQVRLLSNQLVIVVPESNPGNVMAPDDLLSDGVQKVALAGEQVPAGMYADQALTKLELLAPLTAAGKIVRGQDVRVALSYVERGEAEAGIVYSTDVRGVSGVKVAFEIDPASHDEIIYVLVRLKSERQNPAAQSFYEYLQSAAADPVYTEFGFQRPAAARQP